MSILQSMILLQTKYKFLATPDKTSIIIFAIVIAGFIALLVIGSITSSRKSAKTPTERRRYSRHLFKQMGKSMGLSKTHIEYLEHLVKATKVRQPMLVFTSAGLLDDVLKKGLYSLQNRSNITDEQRERETSLIFEIKQLIEKNSKKKIGIKTSHFIKPGQIIEFSPEQGGTYPSKVLSNLKDMLACLVPRDGAGNELRWKRGTKLRVSFWRDNDAGYSFFTKVLGYNVVKGLPAVFIQHSKTLRREQKRRFKRKILERPCFFYPISIVEVGAGRKKTKRAVIHNNRKSLGTVIDISAGGCSIRSLTPLQRGSLIKVDFEIERNTPIIAFGKVRRVRTEKTKGGIMHIMFTRVSRRNLNQIYTYVYDFNIPLVSTKV